MNFDGAADGIANVLHDPGIQGEPLTAKNQADAIAMAVAFVHQRRRPFERQPDLMPLTAER